MGACNPVFLKGFAKQSPGTIEFRQIFDPTFEKALYKFEISSGRKNLTGLAMFKKIRKSNSIRTVLMSETSLKYFDFEFFETDSIIVNYVMDAMNRKALIHLLTEDLSLLFHQVEDAQMVYYSPQKGLKSLVVKVKGHGSDYYIFRDKSEPPSEVRHKAFLSTRAIVAIDYDEKYIPSNIIFTHRIINLKINFQLINQ